jgi:hypothetical protein
MFCDELQTEREDREKESHKKGDRRHITGEEGSKAGKEKKLLPVVLVIFCMQSNITFLSVV